MTKVRWVCRICGLVFVREDGVDTHELMGNHIVDRRESCGTCGSWTPYIGCPDCGNGAVGPTA